MKRQVNKENYLFKKYISKERWASMWHQLDEVLSLNPENILEVGPGPGYFKTMCHNLGFKVKTLDIASDLNPDYLSSASDMPLNNEEFDCVCSFQMLEHLPYDLTLKALSEMARVSKRYIIISLPNAKTVYPVNIHIPKFGRKSIFIPKPALIKKEHVFDGEHHWEINKKNYELDKVQKDFLNIMKEFYLMKSYRVPENPYHHFFIFSKKS